MSKMIKITEIIEELDFKAKLYRTFEMKEARKTYDEYVRLIVDESDLSYIEKDNLIDYWHRIKQDGYK